MWDINFVSCLVAINILEDKYVNYVTFMIQWNSASPGVEPPLKRAPRAIEINGGVVFVAKKVIIRAKAKWSYGGVSLYFNTI